MGEAAGSGSAGFSYSGVVTHADESSVQSAFNLEYLCAPFIRPAAFSYEEYRRKSIYHPSLYADWKLIYSWPPLTDLKGQPEILKYEQPDILAVSACICPCDLQNVQFFSPVRVLRNERSEVFVTQLVTKEDDIPDALDKQYCTTCRQTPQANKFVILPFDLDNLFHIARYKGVTYTEEMPYSVYLLTKSETLPGRDHVLATLEKIPSLGDRLGAPTYEM